MPLRNLLQTYAHSTEKAEHAYALPDFYEF